MDTIQPKVKQLDTAFISALAPREFNCDANWICYRASAFLLAAVVEATSDLRFDDVLRQCLAKAVRRAVDENTMNPVDYCLKYEIPTATEKQEQ